MKSTLIGLLAAAAVVAFAAFLDAAKSDARRPPAGEPAAEPKGAVPSTTPKPAPPSRLNPEGVAAAPGGLEGEHLKRGALGVGVKRLLEATLGENWRTTDRMRVADAIHAIVAQYRPEDADYLIDVFNRTKDPAFRWFFAALVRQIPDDRFADALVETARIDPVQAAQALGHVGGPKSMAALGALVDAEPDGDVRAAMFGAVASSSWIGKADYFARIAGDEARADVDRMHAMVALGRCGLDDASLGYLVDVALGPARPAKNLGNLAPSHPVADLRSAAISGVLQRGDLDAARKLMDAADAPNADPTLRALVDDHLATYAGPDLTEFLYARAARRERITRGEVLLLQKFQKQDDLARLELLLPYAADAETKDLLTAMGGFGR